MFIPSRTQTPAPIFAFLFQVQHLNSSPLWVWVLDKFSLCDREEPSLCRVHQHTVLCVVTAWLFKGVCGKNKSKVQLWGIIILSASFKLIISFLSAADYNNSWATTVIFWMEGWGKCDPVIKQSPAMLKAWRSPVSMCD